MFYSLKSRTLTIASLMFILVVAIASYGRIIFEDTILYGVENTRKQNDLSQLIGDMEIPLLALESKLYQYLISLEKNDKDTIPAYIFELQAQLDNLKSNAIINDNSLFNAHVINLESHIIQLQKAFTKLVNFTRKERYPITQIIDEKLNPTSKQFFSAIQILMDNQDELKNEPGMENIRQDIQELRYLVAQILSSTRLLFITKTGIFGSNDDTLRFILRNQAEYQDYLNNIVDIFEQYLIANGDDVDLDIEFAIDELMKANKVRKGLIKEILIGVQSEQWRADQYFMEHTLKPILNGIQNEFNGIQSKLKQRADNNTQQTQKASNLLSNFLWLFAALIIAFFIAIYFTIEKWIRIPLIKISNAMNFERAQVSGNSLEIIGIKEIDRVINAFNLMSKEIKVRQTRLSSILQNLGEGIIVVDNNGQIDSFNATAEDIFKTSEFKIKGKNILDLIKLESIQDDIQWLSNMQSDANNEHLNYFLEGQRSNNESFKCDVTVSLMTLNNEAYAIIVVKDATNRILNQLNLEHAKETAEQASKKFEAQVIKLDQSMRELKDTQKQLIESEKSASLSGLVAGVAHEINTPIGVSVTASSHLGEEIKELKQSIVENNMTKAGLEEFIDDALEASNIIDSNLQRAADLVKSFKMVAVDQTSNEQREINLKRYIDEVILSLRPKLKKTTHTIHNDIDESINVLTSPGAISQIFTNFIINSLIHGFEDKESGHISITSVLHNKTLIMSYQDDGKGMKEEYRKKVFDPFFTTKRGNGGSGLGMHIVQNILTQTLHGSINCKSNVNEGCLFELKIPV